MFRITTIVFALLIQACAFTDSTLPVSHNSDADIVGPISELDTINFSLPTMKDARDDRDRIGFKKNGYGQNTADIFTEQTVEAIIENAIVDTLTDNGHAVLETANIGVTGTVDRFWFEMDVNFVTIEFIGNVQCTLNFVDLTSNETIYTSSYTGSHKKKTGAGLEKTWTNVMNQAVDSLVEGIVFDDELAAALEEYSN